MNTSEWINTRIFLLRSKKNQDRILDKRIREFWRLQNLGKRYSDIGDTRESMYCNAQSYYELTWFVVYCDVLGISQIEKIREYKR